MSYWCQMYFQNSATLAGMRVQWVFGLYCVVTFAIFVFVALSMATSCFSPYSFLFMQTNHTLERIWGLVPLVILTFLSWPSMGLLYAMAELETPLITLKCVGHQWYWEYEYSDFGLVSYNSYMVPEEDLKLGEPRMLTVDKSVVLPFSVWCRVLTTSFDVIHSWAVPALGVKSDAVPGRLSESSIKVETPGVFWGQCSEICGALHSFMPIRVEVVSCEIFGKWINFMEEMN
uniref:Cytochrome c oxidase subunit 2 n=1 Tax=Ostrea lurida TaxID=627230 RepID=U3LW51_9BIVA|nr:cytochrome c oxidase subunit II [Ostrea lurida]AGM48337.1 cytochrome c oxidase subunit 2 [Ostrea lurida]